MFDSCQNESGIACYTRFFLGNGGVLLSADANTYTLNGGIIETAIIKDAFSFYEADLTENRLVPPIMELVDGEWVDYTYKFGDTLPTYDEVIRMWASLYVNPDQKDRYVANLNSSNLIKQFEIGNSMPEYVCKIYSSHLGGHFRKYVSYLSKNEETGHIMAINVGYDISKQFEEDQVLQSRMKHTQFRAEMMELIFQNFDRPRVFVEKILERLQELSGADQVVYQGAGDKRIIVSSKTMGKPVQIPEEYCASCPYADIHSDVFKDGYTVMDDCRKGSNGVAVYEKCPVKSEMTRLIYHDGEPYGYLAVHYLKDYHVFTEQGKETFRQLTEIFQSIYSQYLYKEASDRALSAISTMTEDFDYIAAVNQKEMTITRLWASDKIREVEKHIDKNLPSNKRFDEFIHFVVHPDDLEMFLEKSNYFSSIEMLDKQPNYKFEFRTLYNGVEEYYRIKFAYMPDNHDIVIMGLLNIDQQVRREMEAAVFKERADKATELREQMARVMELSDDFQAIYDVDMETGKYDIFSYDNGYADSVLVNLENGADFFADTLKDVEKIVYFEDEDIIRDTFSNREYVRRTLDEQGSFTITYRLLVEGQPAWYRVKVAKKPGADNHFLVGVFYVDKRIRKEAEYQKKLEQSLAVSDYFISSFVSAYYVNLNDGSCTILKRTDELDEAYPIINDYMTSVNEYISRDVHPDDRKMMYEMSSPEYIRDRLAREGAFSAVFRDTMGGTEKNYRFQVIRGADADHAAFGFMDITKELREEKEAQEALEKALVMAQAANMAKSTFLFNMSHDIRTPMNAITGYTAMAKRHINSPDDVSDYLDKIDVSGKQLLSLVNQVLEMSRIESGNVAFEETPVDVIEKTDEIRVVNAAVASEKGIRLTAHTSGIIHKNVLVDVSRANQIVTNILGNAVKYTPEGGSIDYYLEELPCEKEGYGLYRITVRDTGIGMSEEFLEHVFEDFSRENNSTVSHIQGTGLGMSIVKKQVDLMGGSIEIESKPGEGTTVIVSVPMKWDTDAYEHETEEQNIRLGDCQGKRLLLVEDNEMNREIALDILEEEGFIVETADDGDVAVDMVIKALDSDRGCYDAVIMDIQMPRMNGYEATKAIRNVLKPEGIHLPIIALSANAFEEDRQKSYEAGMDAHLAKPIDIKKLKEALEKYL